MEKRLCIQYDNISDWYGGWFVPFRYFVVVVFLFFVFFYCFFFSSFRLALWRGAKMK